MRTKTFLITAALSVAAATSWAQVYSVNAVGYVNLTLPTDGKLAIIANPLNGTNNDVNTILPLGDNADGSAIYRFKNNSYISLGFIGGVGWLTADPDPNALVINPGEAFWIQAANNAGSGLNVTFVGEVPQGHLVSPKPAANQLSMMSSIVPQAARLGNEATTGTLGFPAEDGDAVYTWNGSGFDAYGYIEGVGWLGPDPDVNGPTIPVAGGFFIQSAPTAVKTQWVRDFSVN